MTIRHFRIFIAVASTESITKAAQLLYVTQPTVSVAIREMEQHYGTRFFDRINQRLHITEEGKALLSHATHLISIYDDIETSFQNPDALGILRIGASVNVGSYYLPEYIELFEQQLPNIRTQVRISTTEVIETLLLENQLDLGIVGGIIHSPFIKLSPIFSEAHVAVCCPTHSMAGKTVSLSEFISQPLLCRERNSGAFCAFQSAVSQTRTCLGKFISRSVIGSYLSWPWRYNTTRKTCKKRSFQKSTGPNSYLRFFFSKHSMSCLS